MRGARPGAALERAVHTSRTLRARRKLLVACSGGPDSVALAALVAQSGYDCVLAHVNHEQRASSWQDEAVVLRAGAALNIPVNARSIPARSRGDEATLRRQRYALLSEMAAQEGADAIVTAHNAEDQTETVLLALFRGTGPSGLRGMPPRRKLSEELALLRPLLRFEHNTLLEYCHREGLPYALDPSNEHLQYRRNALRAALRSLRPLFPGLDAAVARAAQLVRDEHAGEPRAALRLRVRELLAEHGLSDVGFVQIEAAVEGIERGSSGRFAMRPGLEVRLAATRRPNRGVPGGGAE